MPIELTDEGLHLSGAALDVVVESLKADLTLMVQTQRQADSGGCPNGRFCRDCAGRRKRISALLEVLRVADKSSDTKLINKQAEKMVSSLFKKEKK